MTEVQVKVGDYVLNNETQKVFKIAIVELGRAFFGVGHKSAVRSVRLDRIHYDHKLRHRNYNWLGPNYTEAVDLYKEAAERIKRQVLDKTDAKLLSTTALT